MKVLQQSLGETLSLDIETHPSNLVNFEWNREQKWNRVRVSTVFARRMLSMESKSTTHNFSFQVQSVR